MTAWRYLLLMTAARASGWTRKTAWNLIQHKVTRRRKAAHLYHGMAHCSQCFRVEKRYLESLIYTVALVRFAR
jgi:hypothetical protein